ncbi:hypothetical protein N7528_004274 [Penicillium herquei]|nr:hypothetical protein N7528_004274 [Penicillium herquei]
MLSFAPFIQNDHIGGELPVCGLLQTPASSSARRLSAMESTRKFDESLQHFAKDFHRKAVIVKCYTKKAEEVCSNALAPSNIRHLPITSRIKSWESAKASLYRRRQEHLVYRRLRDLVEAKNQTWSQYCLETGFHSCNDRLASLQNPAEMFAALHDFGGMRILLYFPGDLEKVAEILNKHFLIVRRVEKGDGSRINLHALRDRLELLKDPRRKEQVESSQRDANRAPHTPKGYRSTHFVVKLQDHDIERGSEYSWKDLVVEIQVETLMMHAWSEVEHGMVYKPITADGRGVSIDEKRILDSINGIVLAGEAALRQLEVSTIKRSAKTPKL